MKPLKLLSIFALLLVSLTVSAQKVKLSDKELYNAIWAMGQMYPDGFTLDVNHPIKYYLQEVLLYKY